MSSSYEEFASNQHSQDRSPSLTRDRSKVGSTLTAYRFNILASISLYFVVLAPETSYLMKRCHVSVTTSHPKKTPFSSHSARSSSNEEFASNQHSQDRSPSLARDRSKVGSTFTAYRLNILASTSLYFVVLAPRTMYLMKLCHVSVSCLHPE